MFAPAGLNTLYERHRETFAMAAAIGEALRGRFYDMDEAIDCLLIAALSGEAMVMIGPPGTAKSRLIRAFCNLIGLLPRETLTGEGGDTAKDDAYFEYLLTEFTEPSELFGYIDIPELQGGRYRLMDDGMMQKAKIVFLDEVFNASSAILNALLTFMNERRFHNRGQSIPTPLKLLVSATNHPPREAGLEAVYDRFLLRCRMRNTARVGLAQEALTDLLQAAWRETHAPDTGATEGWDRFLDLTGDYRDDVNAMTASGALAIDPAHPTLPILTELVSSMVNSELSDMSNRRVVKMSGLVLSMRMLRAARAGEDDIDIRPADFDVLLRYSLDRDDPSAIDRIRQDLGIPA
ncbi:AAA family ATPase [Mesobacterium pallidum]|uniref:AAA family ATPase n=1 Tax=Mesobacterium pallidum TaxID=2872037 RepID=UPI001EE2E3BF|nr:AAA family ATPase [Mesobacterium pallidum]